MKHHVAGRTFGRRTDQRLAMLRGLATSLVEQDRIETTVAKAKELRRVVEPLVTLAKRGDLHARRQAAAVLYRDEAVRKLFGELGPRFKDRPGGYTRILRLGQRRGDGAPMALIEWIPAPKEKGARKGAAAGKESKEAKAPSKAAKKPREKATAKKTEKKS